MPRRQEITMSGFANDIARCYASILETTVDKLDSSSTGQLSHTLDVLNRAAKDDYALGDSSDRHDWIRSVLDVSCIDLLCRKSSRPVRSPLRVEDPSLLGSIKERRQKLVKIDTAHYDNWHFANRVRAWIKTKYGLQLDDLRDRRIFRGQKACDYSFQITDKEFLVECKRINVGQSQTIERFIARLRDSIAQASRQIATSAEVLGLSEYTGTIVLDVSIYGMPQVHSHTDLPNCEVSGWTREGISSVGEQLVADNLNVLLSYDNIVVLEGRPVALVNHVAPLDDARSRSCVFGGFTLTDVIWNEGKTNPRTLGGHMIGLHSTPRSVAWIQYEYAQVSDNSKFWGKGGWHAN